jgi:hypothetical protein
MNILGKLLLIIWPVMISVSAISYRNKQNGVNPWTGGPISWPKAFWLNYTIQTWFILPLIFVFASIPFFLKQILLFHLISWWIRGPLELVMIYRWFNWSPRYGISHDLLHILGCGALVFIHRDEWATLQFGSVAFLASLLVVMILITTCAEISFAILFLRLRTLQEKNDKIYFASDDPKWVFVNRWTMTVVLFSFAHLFYQCYYVIRFF